MRPEWKMSEEGVEGPAKVVATFDGRERADRAVERLHRAAGDHPVAVQRHAAGQDGDDRERHGEVREAGHPAAQFLRVAHLVQALLVLGNRPGRPGGVLVDRHGVLPHVSGPRAGSPGGWRRAGRP